MSKNVTIRTKEYIFIRPVDPREWPLKSIVKITIPINPVYQLKMILEGQLSYSLLNISEIFIHLYKTKNLEYFFENCLHDFDVQNSSALVD
jgi:hypothetical protein